jgi:hypothetical protein
MACEFIKFLSIRAEADFRLVRLRKIPEIPSLNTACGTSALREGAALDTGKISPVFSQKMLLLYPECEVAHSSPAELGLCCRISTFPQYLDRPHETASQNRPAYPTMAGFARICPYLMLRCCYTGKLCVSSARYQVRLNSFHHQKKLSEGEGNACENPDHPRREPPSGSRAQ